MSGCGFTCGDLKVITSNIKAEGEAFKAKYNLVVKDDNPKTKDLTLDKNTFSK